MGSRVHVSGPRCVVGKDVAFVGESGGAQGGGTWSGCGKHAAVVEFSARRTDRRGIGERDHAGETAGRTVDGAVDRAGIGLAPAGEDHGIVRPHNSQHLDIEAELVRPEPGPLRGGKRRRAGDGTPRSSSLVLGVLPAFEAYAAPADRFGVQGAIPGRPDSRDTGASLGVHFDAVRDGTPGFGGEFEVRLQPDADQHEVHVDGVLAGDDPKGALVLDHRRHLGARTDRDAVPLRQLPEGPPERGRQQPRHDLRFPFEQGDRGTPHHGSGGKFQPDEAAANDRDAPGGPQRPREGGRVVEGPEMVYARQVSTGHRKPPGSAADREEQRIELQAGRHPG